MISAKVEIEFGSAFGCSDKLCDSALLLFPKFLLEKKISLCIYISLRFLVISIPMEPTNERQEAIWNRILIIAHNSLSRLGHSYET